DHPSARVVGRGYAAHQAVHDRRAIDRGVAFRRARIIGLWIYDSGGDKLIEIQPFTVGFARGLPEEDIALCDIDRLLLEVPIFVWAKAELHDRQAVRRCRKGDRRLLMGTGYRRRLRPNAPWRKLKKSGEKNAQIEISASPH